jgi:TolB-like protein
VEFKKALELDQGISVEGIRRELDRLLNSKTFRRSGRLSAFLRFSVEAVLGGRGRLQEYEIGIVVLDRTRDFDPRIDPSVRVQAHRLRSKLRQYYKTEGRYDPLEITLPLGTYSPVFRPRQPDVERRFYSIVVVPFTNLDSRNEKHPDQFDKGLTEELIHVLAQSREWKLVVAGVQEASGCYSLPEEIAKASGASAIVRGTVRRWRNDMFRISVGIFLSDATLVWSEMFDISAEDIVSAQEKAALEICQALNCRLHSLFYSA